MIIEYRWNVLYELLFSLKFFIIFKYNMACNFQNVLTEKTHFIKLCNSFGKKTIEARIYDFFIYLIVVYNLHLIVETNEISLKTLFVLLYSHLQ